MNGSKRRMGFCLVLLLLFGCCYGATAVELTDAPNTSTQDSVLSLEAPWLDNSGETYGLAVVPADQLTVATVIDIFKFVVEEGNRPARYFPDYTQQGIEEILDGGDPDILYMTEFMRLEADATDAQADVETVMLLDVDYQPGQLVVVVLGDTTDPNNLIWTPLEAEVTAQGQVECVIPQTLLEQLQGEDVLYSLLTVRRGMARGNVVQAKQSTPVELPSIRAQDTVSNSGMAAANGEELDEDFQLIIVEETLPQLDELAMLRDYVKNQLQPVASWLMPEDQQELQLLLGSDYDLNELVVYDYLPLETINYQDTYGDVITTFTFATPYQEGQKIVTVLGMPKTDVVSGETQMDWAVQIAHVSQEGSVEVTFDQLMLSKMLEEPGLLMLLCDPFSW